MACKCYHAERNFIGKIGVCWGTKEREACSCGGDESQCDFYEDKRKKETPKTTHADRIRAMTDEELDKFLGDVQWDVANYCGGITQKQEYPVPEQRGAWFDWLKSPVEVEE